MKKLLAIMSLLILSIVSVTATDMDLDPQWTNAGFTDSVPVEVCVTRTSGGPYVGLVLEITDVCRDRDHDDACDDGTNDIIFPNDPTDSVWVEVTASPTDGNGCGEITYHTDAAEPGVYAARVNGKTAGGVDVDSEYGGFYIPEFSSVGALAILAGAGIYIGKRRKKK